MAEGIVVKVWNVTANAGERSGAAQMASSINYIENPEKVAVKLGDSVISQVSNELNYVMNKIKTMDGLYIGGRRITDFQNAINEMIQVKEFYGKMDGRVALHGIVSLPAEESDPKNAGKLMLLLDEVMAEVFPNHQVVYAVHTNTENLHVHFIINTVGMDGKKIHMDKNFMKQVLQPIVNEKAEKYGFHINEKWSRDYKKDEMTLVQKKMLLSKLIDHAIEQTDDFASFIAYLRKDGLQVNVGKHLSLQLDGMAKPMRSGRLGEDYTIYSICRRISTKRDPIVWKGIREQAHYISEKEMLLFTPTKMKRYKDMTDDEKKKAIRLLKLKRNPWEEIREQNWQIQRMSKELNETGFVYELVHFYSNGADDARMALAELAKRRQELSEERETVKKNLKANRDIVSIYDELGRYMQNAYLYEAKGMTEYVDDYKTYMELVDRLERIYGKSVDEVASFVEDQRNQMQYAKAQDTELKNQYSAIKKYMEKGSFRVNEEGLSFFKAVGHSEARRDARDYGIFASDVKYIIAKGNSDVVVRVMTSPDVIDGKATVSTTITVMNERDEVLREISSKDCNPKEFNDAIFEIANEYGLKECQTHKRNIRKNL